MACHGGLLSDEMGLGKTCQAICFLLVVKSKDKEKRPSLVLSPLSVLKNWKLEIQRSVWARSCIH